MSTIATYNALSIMEPLSTMRVVPYLMWCDIWYGGLYHMLEKYLILSAIIFTICSGVFIFMINRSVDIYLEDQFPTPKDLNYSENDK